MNINDLTQVRVMAYDDLYPEGTSTATVDVTMQRNENRPRWQHEVPIRVTIKETEPVGYVVTNKPRAVDQDGVSFFFAQSCYQS